MGTGIIQGSQEQAPVKSWQLAQEIEILQHEGQDQGDCVGVIPVITVTT